MMRIDVEVYKGPLSERPGVQWGMVNGHLLAARKALIETDNFTRAVMASKGFKHRADDNADKFVNDKPKEVGWFVPRIITDINGEISNDRILRADGNGDSQKNAVNEAVVEKVFHKTKVDQACKEVNPDVSWYEFRFWRLFGLLDDMDHFDCLMLVTLISDTDMLITRVDDLVKEVREFLDVREEEVVAHQDKAKFKEDQKKHVDQFIRTASRISAMLRDQAFRWAVASTAGQSMNYKVRIAVVNSIVAASEIGNQLKCRINALSKQLDEDVGLDRREQAPSVALCDTEPTDFVNLYAQLDATMPSLVGKYILGIGWVEDRVKIVKNLFSDHYWSHVNTVYASGRGKTSMAFIKDDVGNWNLKSFDNDPEELLKAYTDFSVEAAKRAAMAIQSASPGGPVAPALTLATRLMEQANANAFNQEATRIEATIIPRLHRATEARLLSVSKKYQEKDNELLHDYEQKLKKVNDSRESGNRDAERQPVVDAKKALIQHRSSMLAELQDVIRDHKKTISTYADAD